MVSFSYYLYIHSFSYYFTFIWTVLFADLSGCVAQEISSIFYLSRKCIEISILLPLVIPPFQFLATLINGYVLPVCLTPRLHFFPIYARRQSPARILFILAFSVLLNRDGETRQNGCHRQACSLACYFVSRSGIFVLIAGPYWKAVNCKFYDPKEVNYENQFLLLQIEWKTLAVPQYFDFRLRRDSDRCVCLLLLIRTAIRSMSDGIWMQLQPWKASFSLLPIHHCFYSVDVGKRKPIR